MQSLFFHSARRSLPLLAAAVASSSAAALAADLVVCPTCELSSIRAALARASGGDRIRIRSGTYAEGNLIVDRRVELIGEGAPVLDGQDQHEILTIRADGVVVRGLVLRNSGTSYTEDLAAIKVENAEGCRIEDNRLIDNFFGIYLARSANCVIAGNTIEGSAVTETSSGNAIHAWDCRTLRVERNRTSGHRDGIYFEFLRYGDISGNWSEGNLRYGLHFMFSNHANYHDNVFRDNGAGVAVMYSKDVDMAGNRFEHNWGASSYGLLLKDIDDSRIRHNVFFENSTGVLADGANRVNIEQNDFLRNGWAARVMTSSMGVAFLHNNFIDNSFDVTTTGQSQFNSFVENHWSQYRGYDLNRDGIGDVPYRPVSLFSVLVENYPESIMLLKAPLVALLDLAERVMPILTPKHLTDQRPQMRRIAWSRSGT